MRAKSCNDAGRIITPAALSQEVRECEVLCHVSRVSGHASQLMDDERRQQLQRLSAAAASKNLWQGDV